MTDLVSRVSRVLVRGPLAPFAEEYRGELLASGERRGPPSISCGRCRG